jgi:hypothetical protein
MRSISIVLQLPVRELLKASYALMQSVRRRRIEQREQKTAKAG